MAAIHGRVSRTNILIAAGCELEATDKYGRTPLHVAAFFGHELLIGVLLSAGDTHNLPAGSDPRRKDFSGCTPIHMSATSGHLEACRKLAMVGAELDATDMYGRNCLHMSAFNGSIECLDFLISSGADCRSVDSLGLYTSQNLILISCILFRSPASALRRGQVSLWQPVQPGELWGSCGSSGQ